MHLGEIWGMRLGLLYPLPNADLMMRPVGLPTDVLLSLWAVGIPVYMEATCRPIIRGLKSCSHKLRLIRKYNQKMII
jgi:hypothetical protein